MTFAEQIRRARAVRKAERHDPRTRELRCPLCHWNYVGDPAKAIVRLGEHAALMHAHPVKGQP